MRILIIAATHGDELLGVKIYRRLLQKRSPLLEYIDFMIGNPKAFAANCRYIDSDLNRCYGVVGDLYEQNRAQEIASYIRATSPDLVLDMHTTSCRQPNCLIVSDLRGEMKRRMLASSHITNVLQAKKMHDITTCGSNVIGYEVTNVSITTALLDEIISDLQRFIDNTTSFPSKKLFKMQGKIYKGSVTEEQAATFTNFEMNTLGFVPIMTGNNSYKKQTDYLGFKSSAGKDYRL